MWYISKKSEYALQFLVALTQETSRSYIPISKIAQDFDLPVKFLSKIALQLKKVGWVESREGTTGGYKLLKDPKDLDIASMVAIVDEPFGLVNCLRAKGCPKADSCVFKPTWGKIGDDMKKMLEKYTVADFLA